MFCDRDKFLLWKSVQEKDMGKCMACVGTIILHKLAAVYGMKYHLLELEYVMNRSFYRINY